jgi:hypothetical protein
MVKTKVKDYLKITDTDLQWFDDVSQRYKILHDDPDNCSPMIIISCPVEGLPTWEERLSDPIVMLKSELDQLRPHLELQDDYAPTVRVQFGTGQVAAAFGCELEIPTNSLPAVATHILQHAEDIERMPMPGLDAGWFGKLAEWTDIWKKHIPEGINIQHPDIQSPFNTAHLIRGNDIFLDLYDNPELVDKLLDKVTDYMIALTPHLKSMISNDQEWFYDFGSLYRGSARLSNCSMHMISPETYRNHILSRDQRFFDAVGGGRIHYCGTSAEVFKDFFNVKNMYALDFFSKHHDLFQICEMTPREISLCCWDDVDSPSIRRMLAGEWPGKRNIIVGVNVKSLEQGSSVISQLRRVCK